MKILVVDSDRAVGQSLVDGLRASGWEADLATDRETALRELDRVDLVLTDVQMPGMGGTELLREARRIKPGIEVIMMTAYGTIPDAVEAMKQGARAYLTKPFKEEELYVHVREVQRTLDLRKAADRAGRGKLVGASRAMHRVYAEIDVAADSLAPVLITGETGTGKDLAANAIHELSERRHAPFVAANLGAIPKELLEGELFGHEKGAFTGAHARKQGRFSLAVGGTLFLDEIDSMPLELQPKLLRAVETSEVWALGAEKAQHINARIIAATNSDIDEFVRTGMFREDLYYRLHVLRIHMPALREHVEDIPQIAQALLDRTGYDVELEPHALSYLLTGDWKGNVRELGNTLERALARAIASVDKTAGADRPRIRLTTVSLGVPEDGESPARELPFREGKARAAEQWARNAIQSALKRTGGNVSAAARQLQMSRTALIRLINRYGIQR